MGGSELKLILVLCVTVAWLALLLIPALSCSLPLNGKSTSPLKRLTTRSDTCNILYRELIQITVKKLRSKWTAPEVNQDWSTQFFSSMRCQRSHLHPLSLQGFSPRANHNWDSLSNHNSKIYPAIARDNWTPSPRPRKSSGVASLRPSLDFLSVGKSFFFG